MTLDMWITLAILALAIIFFVTEWLRVDVVALAVVVALMFSGVLTTSEALAGFSSTAVLLIAALFIVGGAVFQTGLAGMIGNQILRVAGGSETRLVAVVMIAVAVMSGFMSDTGVVAVMLPAIISMAVSAQLSPSRLLIPLAFGSLLGGASTLIGTPPNIIINETLMEAQAAGMAVETFDFFSYTPLAIILVITGILFMVTIGRHLLPARVKQRDTQEVETPAELIEAYKLPDNIYRLRVRKASPLIGKEVGESGFGHDFNLSVVEISRPAPPRTVARLGEQEIVVQSKKNIPVHPQEDTILQRDDVLIVKGDGNDVGRASAALTLAIQPRTREDREALVSNEVGVAEVVIPPRSSLIGKTLVELNFGRSYRLTVLDIKRPDSTRKLQVKDTRLRFGDILLVQGEWKDIFALRRKRRDFVVMGETEMEEYMLNRKKAPIAALILLGMLLLMVLGGESGISTTGAAMLAALAAVLTGCLTMDEAYNAIDWKSIVLIAGMLPMSTALEKVGLVDMIAGGFTETLGSVGPLAVMAGLFLLTSTFTQVLSNTATAVLIAPIALAAAINLDVTPYAFLMSVGVAASMAFASPVASPVNTLVMGAGQYRFSDYLKIGIPMIILTFIVSMIALPILFPF